MLGAQLEPEVETTSALFKKASEKAKHHAASRLMLEDMVKRAERKLEELKKASLFSASLENKADDEMLYAPGSLLTEDEFAHMYTASGCEELNSFNGTCLKQPTVFSFRSIDGTCNNLIKPLQGASGTSFRRLYPALYEDEYGSLRGASQARSPEPNFWRFPLSGPFAPPVPSARLISETVVRDNTENELPLNHAIMQWAQFLDHDIDLSPMLSEVCEGCNFTDVCEPIRVSKFDDDLGLWTPNNAECLTFRRTVPVCNADDSGSFSPREQINDITSYIDASMIYGSNQQLESAVRVPDSFLLKTGPTINGWPTLPIDTEGLVDCLGRSPPDCFLCGDIRCNEQISLSVMHTVWLRRHNQIAAELHRINPHWSNERTFQEARKIIGALIQKITYYEYLPTVMSSAIFNLTIGPYHGYDRTANASIPNAFATAAFRYGHSLIQPEFERLGPGYQPLAMGPLSLADMFFRPDQISNSGGTDSIVRGWLSQRPRRVDEFLNSVLTTQLFSNTNVPGAGPDLASLNIQRQRDHGMPTYGTWRDFCQEMFPELPSPQIRSLLTAFRFLRLYGSVSGADLWVAGLAEQTNFRSYIGPTFACLFGLTFKNLRDGDRFYFERDGMFTHDQFAMIRGQTLSRVLCDTGNIRTITPNAFFTNATIGHVPCDILPTFDLEPWREEVCFARITGNFLADQRIVSAVISNAASLSLKLFSNDDNAACLPFSCPTSSMPIAMYAYPLIQDLDDCSVTSTLGNIPFVHERASCIIEEITDANIIPANGLFRSLRRCRRSDSTAAITWSCPSVPPPAANSDGDINDPDSGIQHPLGLSLFYWYISGQ